MKPVAKCFGAMVVTLKFASASVAAVASVHPNGHELLAFCNATTADDDGDERYAKCEAYIRKTRQQLLTEPVHGLRACISRQVSELSLVFSAINWLEDRPQDGHLEADEVLARAYARTWPCPHNR